MTAANGKSSRRERLLNRKRPTAQVPIQVADPTRAQREVAYAEEAFRVAHLAPEEARAKTIAEAHRKLGAAVDALDACFEKITVRALPPSEFEALVAAHPPRPDKELKDEDKGEVWNGVTFPRALFLACADGDLSRTEWEAFLDEQCSQAERDQLYLAAQAINVRAPSYAVPKD